MPARTEVLRFRASPSRLLNVNEKISNAQIKRVTDVEFDGLLDVPCKRIPAELASWLIVECFDANTSQLVLPGRGRILVTADAVHNVLGLPNNGDEVRYTLDGDAIQFINATCGFESGQAPTIESIMQRVIDNKEPDDDFLRCWIMIAVSTFLCPPTSLNISPRCYPPLVHLDRVNKLNWCQFVVDELKEAARNIDKKDSIMGCLLFLVILYVDSLDVHNVEIPGTKPKIRAFSWRLLNKVIKLDKNRNGSFGKLKLKSADVTGHSVLQESLFNMDDISSFVSSKVSVGMSDQRKRKLSAAFGQLCGGLTDLLGTFLEQVSGIEEHDGAGTYSAHSSTRVKRQRESDIGTDSGEDSYYITDYEDEDDSKEDEGYDHDETVLEDATESAGQGQTEGIQQNQGAPMSEGAGQAQTEGIQQNQDATMSEGATNTVEESKQACHVYDITEEDHVPLIRQLNKIIEASKGTGQPHVASASEASAINSIPLMIVPPDLFNTKMGLGDTRRARLKLKLNPNTHVDAMGERKVGSSASKTVMGKVGMAPSRCRDNPLYFTPPEIDIMKFVLINDDNIAAKPVPAKPVQDGDNIEISKPTVVEEQPTKSGPTIIPMASSSSCEGMDLTNPNEASTSKVLPTHLPEVEPTPNMPSDSPLTDPGSANLSITPVFRQAPCRAPKVAAALRSPYVQAMVTKTFKCNKEVCDVYNAVCSASAGRSTRSSSQDKRRETIIIVYPILYVRLRELADSVKPGAKMLNVVVEAGIFAIEPKTRKAKRRIMPLRVSTFLQSGDIDKKEVTRNFICPLNHLLIRRK